MTNPSPSGYADTGLVYCVLYRRFPDRATLVAALARRYLASINEALSDAAGSTDDPWTAIRGFVTWVAASGHGPLATALSTLPEGSVGDPDDFQAQQQRWEGQLRDLVHRAQADGSMRPDVSTEDLVHLLDLFTCHPAALPAPIAAEPGRYLQLVLDGLEVRPAE